MGASSLYMTAGTAKRPSREDWAEIWFAKLAKFHRIDQPQQWSFTQQDVIDFLRANLEANMPAWKRLKIVDGLICYRNRRLRSETPELESIRTKLQEIAIAEKHGEDDEIEEVASKIKASDPDIIQQMQRTMRFQRKKPNTEIAYLKWVREFMKERCLKSAADFQDIGPSDVETYLTDMVVDGDVAKSTQDQAFSAMLYLFEQVLKRDLGTIRAIRRSFLATTAPAGGIVTICTSARSRSI